MNRLLLRDNVQPVAHTRFSRRSNFRNSQSKWKKAGIPWPHSFPFLILSYHWSITETVTVKWETPAGTLLQTAFLGFVLISDWPGGLFFSLLSLLWLHRGHINSDSLSNRSLQPTDNKGCVAAYISFSLTLPTALCSAASKNPVSPRTPPVVASSRQQISYLIFNAPPQCTGHHKESGEYAIWTRSTAITTVLILIHCPIQTSKTCRCRGIQLLAGYNQ